MDFSKIDLSQVYFFLDKILEEESYILTDCISRVVAVKDKTPLASAVNTLAISRDGTLYISEKFCNEFVKDNLCLTVLLTHELLHQVLHDTAFMERIDKKDKDLRMKLMAANIAFDARINAVLSVLYNNSLNVNENFKNIYETIPEKDREPLLALCYSNNEATVKKLLGEEAVGIYLSFYERGDVKDFYRLYEIILEYMDANRSKYECPKKVILFIGNHGDGEGESIEATDENGDPIELCEQDRQAIGKALADKIKKDQIEGKSPEGIKPPKESNGKQAGHYDIISTILVPILEQKVERTFSKDLLKKVAVDHICKNMKISATRKIAKWKSSPIIPKKLAKSDMLSVMMGMDVLLWKHYKETSLFDPKLVPIYFDVSGSMTSYIPLVLDLILTIDAKIDFIWCFSDYVVQHSLEELKDRKIKTSGGTSFEAVVQHIRENEFESVMVITDGYGSVNQEKPECLKEVITILVEGSDYNSWFSKKFPDKTYDLQKIVKGEVVLS